MKILYEDGGGDGGNGGSNNGPALPDGTFLATDFKAALPEDLRGHSSLAKINTLEEMGRSFIAAQHFIGKDTSNLVEFPAEGDKEGLRALQTRMGLPKEATTETYKLEAPADLPETIAKGFDPAGPLAASFVKMSHDLGLLPEQARGLYNWYATTSSQAVRDEEVQDKETDAGNISKLRAEFGIAFDQKLAAADFAISKLGGDPLREAINKAGLGTDIPMMKALAHVGKIMEEDSIEGLTGGTGEGTLVFSGKLTPDEAKIKADDLTQRAINETNPRERRRLSEEAAKVRNSAL